MKFIHFSCNRETEGRPSLQYQLNNTGLYRLVLKDYRQFVLFQRRRLQRYQFVLDFKNDTILSNSFFERMPP